MTDGTVMRVVVRSYREFLRFSRVGDADGDTVHAWLNAWTDCTVYWDVGSANGLEGFFMQARHDASVVFIEPFTPSVETILKTIYSLAHQDAKPGQFDVVQALCDEHSGLGTVVIYGAPIPGGTKNAAGGELDAYYYTKSAKELSTKQWLAQVSLDDLRFVHGFAAPSHVKIDVDGYEMHALRGARKLIESREVRAFIVEVNGENGDLVNALFSAHGYVKSGVVDHGRPPPYQAQDHLFLRDDVLPGP